MGSKEAVNAVLNHETPAYIPLGTYAIDCDIAEKVLGHKTYVRNKIDIQIALWEGRRDEVVQSLKEDSVELFKKLDCIDIIIPFKEAPLLPPKGYIPPKVKKLNDTTWEVNGYIYQYSQFTNDISVVKYPPTDHEKLMKKEPELVEEDGTVFEAYDHLIENMRDDRYIAGVSGGFDPMPLIGGMENGLMEYYLDPELVRKVIDDNVILHNYRDQFYIREGTDGIFIESDPATTNAPLISPQMYRDFCLGAIKERVKNIKKYRDKVFLHSCGNTWKLMDMFIEAGIDCNQSLQTGAGMDIGLLKARYGTKIAFWGGVAVEKLISATTEEVREDVRYAMSRGSSEGGFILGPSHSIAFGVKYDNFMAMLDEHDKLKYIR